MAMMATQKEAQKPIEVFCCYARKDQSLLDELKKHLMPLIREGIIMLWADTDISAGAEWEKEIHLHLNTASLVLLLVSPDFMASDYCYSVEMQRALERHERGEARIIPIILRPTSWQRTPLGKLQALPADASPITSGKWHHQDEAFYNVAEEIRDIVEDRKAKDKAAEAEQARLAKEDRLRKAEEERVKIQQKEQLYKVGEVDQAREEVQSKKREIKKREPIEDLKQDKSEHETRRNFIESTINTIPFIVWSQAFILLTGLGSLTDLLIHPTSLLAWTVGTVSLPLPWTVGVVVLATPLIYLLGYRKAIDFLTISIIGLMSAVTVFGLTVFISRLDFDHQVTSNLWFNLTRIVWLGRQVNSGLIVGLIFGVLIGYSPRFRLRYRRQHGDLLDLEIGLMMIYYPLIFSGGVWLILAIFALVFQWGFGFGYGWDTSLIAVSVAFFVTVGLNFLFSVWREASKVTTVK